MLSTLPEDTPLDVLVDTAKLRWRIERDYEELKGELGLAHFERRIWRGFHYHAALCIAANPARTAHRRFDRDDDGLPGDRSERFGAARRRALEHRLALAWRADRRRANDRREPGEHDATDMCHYIHVFSYSHMLGTFREGVLMSFRPGLSFFAAVLALAFAPYVVRAQSGQAPPAPVKHDTLANRLVVGFQGWFRCPQDASSGHRWGHWFTYRPPLDDNNVTPAQFHADLAPDTSELSPGERCSTPFTIKDGRPFVLFSDENPKTVLRQFQWMAEYKVDVAALQRFVVAIEPERPAAFRQGWDKVLHNALDAADATGRGFYVMYDIAGAPPHEWAHVLVEDWKKLLAEGVTKRPSYQYHHGRPVLAIAGPGLSGRPGTAQETLEVVRQLREVSKPYGGLTLIVTGGSGWRTLNYDVQSGPEWAQVYRSFDIVSPWTVGRYRNQAGFDRFVLERIRPDLAETKRDSIEYMPVVYPGTSQHNLFISEKGSNTQGFNLVPRDCGQFIWSQAAREKKEGANMLYVAMFDEVDEGTAMFKLAQPADDPREVPMLSLDADGCKLPSDWYLRVLREISLMLKSSVPPSDKLPLRIPH